MNQNINHTLIIAEAGVNHNGSLDMAIDMVHAAARSGADFVKFQTFRADRLVTPDAPKAQYQLRNDGDDSQYEMLRRLELSDDDFECLAEECRMVGIGFMSTPFDIESANWLARIGQPYWKIPSGEVTNLPLLRHIAGLGGKIIMSTGMARLDEVRDAVRVLDEAGVDLKNIALLHCTTAYPTPTDDVNLRAMEALRTLGTGAVGYSDHTRSRAIPVAAVALGAEVIEKHFTLDSHLPGPDHAASFTPSEFRAMVDAIRTVEVALGVPDKQPSRAERVNIAIARRSIVAARDISAGEIFTAENLTTKRPATGMSPMLWDTLIGKPSPRPYSANEQIQPLD